MINTLQGDNKAVPKNKTTKNPEWKREHRGAGPPCVVLVDMKKKKKLFVAGVQRERERRWTSDNLSSTLCLVPRKVRLGS